MYAQFRKALMCGKYISKNKVKPDAFHSCS